MHVLHMQGPAGRAYYAQTQLAELHPNAAMGGTLSHLDGTGSQLVKAVKSGNTSLAVELISAHPRLICYADMRQFTVLHFAARTGGYHGGRLHATCRPQPRKHLQSGCQDGACFAVRACATSLRSMAVHACSGHSLVDCLKMAW